MEISGSKELCTTYKEMTVYRFFKNFNVMICLGALLIMRMKGLSKHSQVSKKRKLW